MHMQHILIVLCVNFLHGECSATSPTTAISAPIVRLLASPILLPTNADDAEDPSRRGEACRSDARNGEIQGESGERLGFGRKVWS